MHEACGSCRGVWCHVDVGEGPQGAVSWKGLCCKHVQARSLEGTSLKGCAGSAMRGTHFFGPKLDGQATLATLLQKYT